MSSLVQSLVRQDAKTFFAENCEQLFREWTSLLQRTTLPAGITCADKRVLDAFEVLNAQIAEGSIFSRLAYVRLAQTFAALEEIIETDRENGRIAPRKGRGNAKHRH
ncbi:hypothetical protein QBC46DRAFT_338117 [Diplogelasinospora grovesii]|uniref:Uncharacterized protein n=1 Tax=Diplogelasinospora grovesii TaxID=303347 RepID=A0AAN6S7Y3_9PEZI|nr:hypothetical protein QBC46DRAFT_338117 [Diplogelasinospora grovesii]